VLFNRLASLNGSEEEEDQKLQVEDEQSNPGSKGQQLSPSAASAVTAGGRISLNGTKPASHRFSMTGSVAGSVATSRGVARIRELSETMQGGAPTPKTLERVRSINKTVQRSMDNVSLTLHECVCCCALV